MSEANLQARSHSQETSKISDGKNTPQAPQSESEVDGSPKEYSRKVEEIMGFMASGPMPNPVMKQIRPEHIDKVLDYANEQASREDAQATSERRYIFGGLVFFIALIVFIIIYLKDTPTILTGVLSAIGGLFTGFLAGFGVGKAR